MFGNRPANALEADHREDSLRSAVPLVAAAFLFGLGAVGLATVLPYSIGHSGDPLLVTSPSQTPGEDAIRVQDIPALSGLTEETIPADVPATPTREPTELAAVVFAVSASDQGIAGVTPIADPPTPAPTDPPATKTPIPTPTAEPSPSPAPTVTPTPRNNFIPDSNEPGPIKQAEPVTAFIDPSFQQPAPEAPFSTGGSQFPVTP